MSPIVETISHVPGEIRQMLTFANGVEGSLAIGALQTLAAITLVFGGCSVPGICFLRVLYGLATSR